MAEKTQKSEQLIQSPAAKPVVKIGLAAPFQIVGGDVFTFIDCMRNRASMTVEEHGVMVTVLSRSVPPVSKTFLVPWSNVTYVLYGF